MASINHKISTGVLWNIASIVVSRGASTIFTLFLARLLVPEAFGLIAMATIVFELANSFIESGLGQALIRSKFVSDIDLNTVFFTNLAFSLFAYLLLFFSAPLISDFYSQPELTIVIQVIGLVVFVNACKIVQTSILAREMNFKSQMKANTLGVIMSGILSVSMAWSGLGVWSLVAQMLSSALISSCVLWFCSSWRPKFKYSFKSFRRLFGFGRNLLIDGILNILFQNSYVLVIGRLFSAEITGLYFFAKKISTLISRQLSDAVQQATFPALATLQDNEALLKAKYRKVLQIMMFLITPVLCLVAALAVPIFSLLFNTNWLAATTYFQLLCIVGLLYPLHALNINLLSTKGRSDLILKVGLVKKFVNIIVLIVSIPYGIIGIIVGQALSSALALIPNAYFSRKLIDYSLQEQLKDVFKPFFAACIAYLIVYYSIILLDTKNYVTIIAGGSVGLISYLLISFLIKSEGCMLLCRKLSPRIKLFLNKS